MEFNNLIKKSTFLNNLFSNFPKNIVHVIEKDDGTIRWSDSGTAILINIVKLSNYLISEESVFPVRSIFDFVKCLDLLGFERFSDKREGFERFFHSYFQQKKNPGIPLLMRDLKNEAQPPRGLKLMKNSFLFLEDLKKLEKRDRVSKLDFARMRLRFALEKELKKAEFIKNNNEPVYEPIFNKQVKNPEYIESGEIAGYYGNVSIDRLKAAFPTYFPTFYEDESPEFEKLQDPEPIREQVFNISEIPVIENFNDQDSTIEISEIILPDYPECSNLIEVVETSEIISGCAEISELIEDQSGFEILPDFPKCLETMAVASELTEDPQALQSDSLDEPMDVDQDEMMEQD